MRARHAVAVLVIAFAIAYVEPSSRMQTPGAPPYSIQSVGTLGGDTMALAMPGNATIDIEHEGFYVVGRSRTPQGRDHAFARQGSTLIDLGTLGGTSSTARDVNVHNIVVGEASNAAGITRAFQMVTSTGVMEDLGSLSGTGSSAATAINGSEFIVGVTQTTSSANSMRAFLYRGGVMSLLGESLGGTRSRANDINGNADVVGLAYTTGDTAYHGFLFRGGVTTDLGTLGGNSEATAISDSGYIAGRSFLADGTTQHAFLYSLRGDRQMHDLGTLGGANSQAFDVSFSGIVVGQSQRAGNSAWRAVMWRNGVITDLNTLLPPGSGWVLQSATHVNSAGQIVGNGTLNGAQRGFLLTPPFDIQTDSVGFEDLASNLPRPVQAGRNIMWVYFVTPANDLPGRATNVTVTDTLTGPVEYVSFDIFRGNGGCEIAGRQLICHFDEISPENWGAFYVATVRTTAAGTVGHTNRITHTDEPDGDLSNNEFSESNTAISVASVAAVPPMVAGGRASGIQVTLTAPHPNGAVVRMTSSNPAVLPMRDTFVVTDLTRSFNVFPVVVAAPTPVQITATYGLVTKTTSLTVMPPAEAAFYLTPTTVIGGCRDVAAKVTLTGAAPPGGAVVSIGETIAAALFPGTLVIPAGTFNHTFSIPTRYVTDYQTGPVTASFGGVTRSVTLTVRPIRAKTVVLTPASIVGGNQVAGLVTLECPAAPNPIVVSLTSGNTAVAAPTMASITIPAGQTTGAFTVRTRPVTTTATVSIHATVFNTRSTSRLEVRAPNP
jgi:probable HAF family extracellular repeat protein